MAATNCDFYYPFDGTDRSVTASIERRFWAQMFTNGVLGGDGLKVEMISDTRGTISPGVAIVGGIVGGVTASKNLTLSTTLGARTYLVLRADTTSSVRKCTLDVVTSPQIDTTQTDLDAGAIIDLPLYQVDYDGSKVTIADLRTFANTYDKSVYENEFAALMDSFRDSGGEAFEGLIDQFQAVIAEADTENAGLYGAQGRQGFINPCFEVNQRGAESYSLTSGTTYTFDRWLARIGGAATASPVTISRQQDGQRAALVIANKQYASGSTAAASCIAQNIEGGVRRFCAGSKKFTVSFDARASSSGAKIAVEPVQYATSGGTGTALTAQTVELTTEWQRFSLTFTGTVNPAANDVLKVAFFFAWRGYSDRFGGDSNYQLNYQFANMQINEGDSGLPCYVRDYADELERCMRYYVALGFTSLSCGATLANTNQVMTSPIPITRRMYKQPTIKAIDRANVSGCASAQIASGTWRNGLTCEVSTSTVEAPVLIVTNTDSASVARVCFNSLVLDAEMYD